MLANPYLILGGRDYEGSVLGNSEEAGASKNEEARASNNEYRCHYQRVEILKEHIREMLRAVAGEEPRCGGITFSAVSALKNSKR